MAVAPITRLQSRVAPATESYSSALARSGAALTADTASRKAFSYGITTRRCNAPKLLMARAAAPIFNGLRERTSTTRKFGRLGRSFNCSTGNYPKGARRPTRGIHILREASRTAAKSRCHVEWHTEQFRKHSRTIDRISWCAIRATAPRRTLHEASAITQIGIIGWCVMERLDIAGKCTGCARIKGSHTGRNQESGRLGQSHHRAGHKAL